MTSSIDYSMLPEHMQEGFMRYFEQGIVGGSFQRGLLENNLSHAVFTCNGPPKQNWLTLRTCVMFLHWEVPSAAWGSKAKVEAWSRKQQIILNDKRLSESGD